jgi:hypothetical protein
MEFGNQKFSTTKICFYKTIFILVVAALAQVAFASTAAPEITSVSDIVANEGQKAVYTVSLSGLTPSGAAVRLNLASGAAEAGSDFSNAIEYSSDGGVSYYYDTSLSAAMFESVPAACQ